MGKKVIGFILITSVIADSSHYGKQNNNTPDQLNPNALNSLALFKQVL